MRLPSLNKEGNEFSLLRQGEERGGFLYLQHPKTHIPHPTPNTQLFPPSFGLRSPVFGLSSPNVTNIILNNSRPSYFYKMPKVVAILLSFFILGQGAFTYAAELEKMDDLLEHAKFHEEEYGDGFASFMSKHYGNQKEDHKDDHGHDQLPFQHCGQLLIQSAFIFAKTTAELSSPLVSETQQNNYFYQQLYSSQLINVLLQPPRTA